MALKARCECVENYIRTIIKFLIREVYGCKGSNILKAVAQWDVAM